MNLPEKFQQYVKKEKLFQPHDRLLIAVSGGVDSVVLCELCKMAGFDFAIAHCNFQLRGADSDEDENFVRQLGEKYAVETHIKRFDTGQYAAEKRMGIQVAARELRYTWFAQLVDLRNGQPFKKLLTAHHANDNIETILINFFKGTGIAGLRGIMPKSGSSQMIIRPLLFTKKEMLIQFAGEYDLAFRNDASNELNKYTRNFFRNDLIPAIKEVYPMVEDNLIDNISRFNEVHVIYRNAIAALKKKLMIEKGGEYYLPVLKLLKTEALNTLIYEFVKAFNFTPGQTADIVKLLQSESGKYVDSSTHRILRNRAWLIISTLGEIGQTYFLIEENDPELRFSKFIISIEKKTGPVKIEEDPSIAMIDAKDIHFPLIIRRWKQGDYFYPLGMKKKKKISRFLIDHKISMTEKEQTWILEMDKKIVWVAGHRIDDRFKLNANTKNIIRFKLSPAK